MMMEYLNAPIVLVFLGTSGLFFLIFLFLEGAPGNTSGRGLLGRDRRGPGRLGDLALLALPRLGAPLVPSDEQQQTRVQRRLIHAGLYGRSALPRFLGIRAVLLVGAVLAGVAIGLSGLLPLAPSLLVGCALVAAAFVAPGLWLDWQKRERQRTFRHALPDVLDILTICLEGGLSLPEALRRVTDELQTVHPLLADEFNIIQRETLLGLSPGEALRKFAARTDLSEARDLASVVLHAERYGVSMVNAMRIESDAMRLERQQRAEEMAQKAAVKVLFPTLLFIFPAIFVVVVGPAVYSIIDTFSNLK
jgi:tight adherence protein C